MNRRGRLGASAGGAVMAAAVVASFFAATTFVGDDHLFLTFARLVRNPLVAFVSDQHGGEFYRPVPMALWWGLARAGGGASWPFALASAGVHTLVAIETAFLLLAVGEEKAVAWTAGIVFFLAPRNLDAAYWFSASTDLLATAATLGSLIVLARAGAHGRWLPVAGSALLAAVAYLCKESALILPLLATLLVLRSGAVGGPRRSWAMVMPHAALAGVFVAARWHILQGWGGSGDVRAPVVGKVLQLLSGLVHILPGQGVLPEPLAWGFGAIAVVVLLRHAYLGISQAQRSPGLALAFVGIALLPLLGAEWAVGARYFYMPAVGVSWLAARALLGTPFAVRAMVLGLLVTCGLLQMSLRRREVIAFDERVAACRRAVADGLDHGHTVFHIRSGVKDLDLAVKEDPTIARHPRAHELLVMTDVPASFVLMPASRAQQAAFVVASPPLPPSGAYRFGEQRVVGLARRGDDPLLTEVVRGFPDIQFIALRLSGAGRVIARDITQEVTGEVRSP